MPATIQPPLPLLVVVTGPPGAGKTTVAVGLRARLALPLLAKDAFKEVLAEPLGVSGREASHRLGASVYELLGRVVCELLGAGVSAIVEGNFTAQTRFLQELPPVRIVQVHLSAEPGKLHARYLSRTDRHAVHYDAEAAGEMRSRAAAGEWAALPLPGELIRFDTTGDPAVAPLLDRVAEAAGLP